MSKPKTPNRVASSAGLDITQELVEQKQKSLGLISMRDAGATEEKCKLSQPRGVLVMLRRMFDDEQDIVMLCDSGITTLTNMIGDKFKP